ncbi:hypothetical protein GUITHDRAFT_114190 [Guillardia theta CCMP2712]|uniref:Bacterial bifunctional deaminase-reductase C-terminal domain-containing protein n=1 Tax=Guillardia theta (strain CCMP2712) TaxID=905079 RepID=L1IV36_GUITC|nr:hypothetical protein GUITHDRAFT_114190 [Guillardia theta CCMP2712]EKX39695.1 hypothetical protein GUITHDRAFT_114190 [Guillardia theta CCMP2712]|eukprot:XP_005826675.1 hypothetical protein GUITHDRAFT_114190 [Guillardia theta CCMP2712]
MVNEQLPIVTLKIALDENGAVDDLGITSKRFTSEQSLDAVHRLRRCSDAVLVGIGTVVRDDPYVPEESSIAGRERTTVKSRDRSFLEDRSACAIMCKVMRDGYKTVIFHSDSDEVDKRRIQLISELEATNQVSFIPTPTNQHRSLDLTSILGELSNLGVKELMLEGGPATVKRFLQQKLVDRAIVIVAPIKFDQLPVPSLIDHHVLKAAGLALLGEHQDWGKDSVSLWSKAQLQWPSPVISEWP